MSDPFSSAPDAMPEAVREALRRGAPVEAIKLLREATGMGLYEAKQAILDYVNGTSQALPARPLTAPFSARVNQALQQGNKIQAIKQLRDETGMDLKQAKDAIDAASARRGAPGLAPGEVPRSGAGFWWLAVIIALAGAAWFFLPYTHA